MTLFGAVLWRHPSHRQYPLDVRRCNVVFARFINVRNTRKRLRYSQIFGGISSGQWRKVGRIWRLQLLFYRFLCVRIALVIWSPLQLTFKQWIITQQFTARADLFLKHTQGITPQGSQGVGRNTFLSSPHLCFIIVFICDLFVSRVDPLMS